MPATEACDPATVVRSRTLRSAEPAWQTATAENTDPVSVQRAGAERYAHRLRRVPQAGDLLDAQAWALRGAYTRQLPASPLPVDERFLSSLGESVVQVTCLRAQRRVLTYAASQPSAASEALLDEDCVWVKITRPDGREIELCLCADEAGCERLDARPLLLGPAQQPAPDAPRAAPVWPLGGG